MLHRTSRLWLTGSHVACCRCQIPRAYRRQAAVLSASSPISEAPAEASRSPVDELQQRLARKSKTRYELRDPANIGARHTHEVTTKDWGGHVSLEAFMRLPVSAYYELDANMIKPLRGNRFALVVPRVHLFNVWVEPLVETEVHASRDEIIIRALNCRINGSDLVEGLGLDNRFCVEFEARLTWTSGQPALPGAQPEPPPSRGGFLPFGWGGSREPEDPMQGRVKGEVNLQVFSEVIGPFNLMPRPVLQGGGSAVMGVLVRTLLPLFLRRLVEDYQHWATDAAYRSARGRRKG